MTFDLKQLAEGRFLNKELLKIFVQYKSGSLSNKPAYFWYNEHGYGGDMLNKYETNTWHCDKLVEEFKAFCEPDTLIKILILSNTYIRGIDLEAYEKEFDSAISEIIRLFNLENNSREIPKI